MMTFPRSTIFYAIIWFFCFWWELFSACSLQISSKSIFHFTRYECSMMTIHGIKDLITVEIHTLEWYVNNGFYAAIIFFSFICLSSNRSCHNFMKSLWANTFIDCVYSHCNVGCCRHIESSIKSADQLNCAWSLMFSHLSGVLAFSKEQIHLLFTLFVAFLGKFIKKSSRCCCISTEEMSEAIEHKIYR